LGKRENGQVGVLLACAGPTRDAFIDRELDLPRPWSQDPERRRDAGVPAAVAFLTKPRLARRMVERVLNAGWPPRG
jgi:SRSO17 transposase